MLKNYLKIAIRNLLKNKGISVINILGLSIGLAACILIALYVLDELSYDKYNKKANRIYRLDNNVSFSGNEFIAAISAAPLGETLKKELPEVEQYVRLRDRGGFLVKKGNENLREDKVVFADSTLFDVFTLPMIAGDPKTALIEPNSLVITERIANKYFNKTDVIGQTLVINDTILYKVTGVIKNVPPQSHFNFDFFAALSKLDESRHTDWSESYLYTYIVLHEGVTQKDLEKRLSVIEDNYILPDLREREHVNIDSFKRSGNHISYAAMPLTKIHLYSNKKAEIDHNGNIQYIYIFSAIAIFILLIACVNFMSLSTARSANRVKEVGVRKVLGSLRINLIVQFLTESFLVSTIALAVALIIVQLILPWFNQLTSREVSISLFLKPWFLASLFSLVFIVGLLAGSYPAFYLSAFKPIQVLKGSLTSGYKRSWMRSGLVVFQFVISIALIIGTTVIYQQLNYIRNKELGFNRKQVLILKNTEPLLEHMKTFKENLLKLPGVESITATDFLPTSGRFNGDGIQTEANSTVNRVIGIQRWPVDEDYIPTLEMKLVTGRNFLKEFVTDSNAIIINEAAAKGLQMINHPLNKTVYIGSYPYHIIGVMKDFNFNSLHVRITPLVLFLEHKRIKSVALRINTKNIQTLVSKVEQQYKAIAPGQPFMYSFMDDEFDNIYKDDQRVGKIAFIFSAIAIVIACLGLFGLVTYMTEQRTKEIGIRKVLGATVANIVSMLSKNFLKLVITAAFIAFPIAWWAMSSWLRDFEYRIGIGWWVFALAGIVTTLISVATVSYQAIKAAITNPVDSLRAE